MSLPSFDDLNSALVPLAIEVGQLILSFYNSDLEVKTKSDDSPVTLADQAAEKSIIETITSCWPHITIVAEEMCAAGIIPDTNDPETNGTFFLIDPLDGTKEFINKRDEFTVNIALIVDNTPYYGLVLTPALGELFITLSEERSGYLQFSKKLGELSRDDKIFDQEKFAPILVRDWPSPGPVGVVSRSHPDDITVEFLKKNNVVEQIAAGSSLKFCQVARGIADIYPRFGPTMEWDTGAGHAVLCSAGGTLVTGSGEEFLYGKYDRNYLNGDFVACSKKELSKIKF
ncbi:3'(2'),5'-bisphosphate nucleotidase CysQ [Hyphomicrobiales bacterium 4NK60-0047b]|jgi:3'(2'), 5'-bisphosphate nucleotidase